MDQNQNQITIEQLLRMSVEQLQNIVVPISYTEQIAIPIVRVMNDLKMGIEAITRAEAAAMQQAETPTLQVEEGEPLIELVEDDQNGSGEA